MPINIIEKPSPNFLAQEIIPKYIILHCIGYQEEQALNILTKTVEEGGGGVSSHYFIPQIEAFSLSSARNYPIYRLVDDTKFARHAGKSKWKEDCDLNDKAIGIEFSSPNYANALVSEVLDWFHFEKFPLTQIMASIDLLKSLIKKFHIQPENIIGHSDIAPWRLNTAGEIILGKTDPGATFPWRFLAQQGIGIWPRDERTRTTPIDFSIEAIQSLLLSAGYSLDTTGQNDLKTAHAIKAFQLHFLPEEIGNEPSSKMIALLENLVDKQYEYSPFTAIEENTAVKKEAIEECQNVTLKRRSYLPTVDAHVKLPLPSSTPDLPTQQVMQTPVLPVKLPLLAVHSLVTKVNELMMIDKIRHEGPAGKGLGFFQQLPPRVLKEIHHISEEAQEAYDQRFGLVPYNG